MSKKIQKALLGGIVGTAVMTAVMMIAPMMGIPKMNPPQMLSMMMNLPIIAGWMMHFMIGIIFAMAYVFLFIHVVTKIDNKILKGAIFGMAVFVFAQIMLAIMGAMLGGVPPMEGSMLLIVVGSIMGHIIFGIVVALFAKVKA
jgi:uncharacterized BrkB/YihY/UPF0761 family membrane protein